MQLRGVHKWPVGLCGVAGVRAAERGAQPWLSWSYASALLL